MRVQTFRSEFAIERLDEGIVEEGTAVSEVCRKAGISEAGKLKKIVADLSLDKEMLQDVLFFELTQSLHLRRHQATVLQRPARLGVETSDLTTRSATKSRSS